MLRAAAVGGGAYMAGKRRAEAQEAEVQQDQRISGLEQQQYAPPAPAPTPAPAAAPSPGMSSDTIEKLTQLGQLHEQGVLTDAEFAQQKAVLLGM